MALSRLFSRELLLFGISLLLFGLFNYLAFELSGGPEGSLQKLDDALLAWLKANRTLNWNRTFLQITALGSLTVLTLFSLTAVIFFLLEAQWGRALQLFLASTVNTWATFSLKTFSSRERPPLADRLDMVTGFSFPSGHSSSSAAIYFTLALLALPLISARLRPTFLATAGLFIALIGVSRAYLAVHYPSDVLAGVSLGSGIALLVHLASNGSSKWHVGEKIKSLWMRRYDV